MFRHNLLLIYRNFKRFKSAFFINLVGLSTGLASALLIYLWVMDEVRMDDFHEHSDRLYQVMEHRVKADGIWTAQTTPGPLAEALVADMPEIEYVVPCSWDGSATLSVGDHNVRAGGRSAGKDFFKIFSYPLVQGDPDKVLVDKSSIVISEALAVKLFGTAAGAIGKTVEVSHWKQTVVTGVFTVPGNSSQQFEYLLSFESFLQGKEWLKSWGNTSLATYVLLKPGVDIDRFNERIADYITVKTNKEIAYRTMFLKRYTEKYLYGQYENGVLVGGRITYVKLFSIIAVFILAIACINFMNLSTAKASRRIKEVGVKKAIGAGRRALVYRYLGESLLLSFLSLLVAILMVDLFLGKFNEITAKNLSLSFDPAIILPCLGITLFTGILAGSYPALYISGFNPAAVLKGKFNSALGELWARKGLVVFQFTLSVIFIVCVMVVYKQVEYVQSKDLGYSRDNIIYFDREGKTDQNLESFLAEVRNIPGVVGAFSSSHDMTGHNSGTNGIEWPGKDPEDRTEFEVVTVGYQMMETLGFHLAEGRMFSPDFASDTSNIILNEAGIEFMGMKDPIGKTVKFWGSDVKIVGVVKDFHYESLHEKYKPALFRFAPGDTYMIMAKLAEGKEKETLERLKQFYEKYNDGFTFDFRFLDEEYQLQYAAEKRVAMLSRYFSVLAILISCLGLFGLASFTAERRQKEIGIRKVLGSGELNIVLLLSNDFTKIVLVAIVIAIPLSYLMTRYWLNTFAYRIDLEWWYFLSAGILALLIAWLTVGSQAMRAARINPSKCLKEE